ncbi:hypothetical protein GCM10011316_19290 [Roseibium aquae]|uniref:Uncharacterized protein n=1 Tax=Roseibium aquae TaxID=1323746 RepID=A0A916TIY2_9HYPH|nr:hypothetical protein GCM10011316_19290 [Roseibium aquae]
MVSGWIAAIETEMRSEAEAGMPVKGNRPAAAGKSLAKDRLHLRRAAPVCAPPKLPIGIL